MTDKYLLEIPITPDKGYDALPQHIFWEKFLRRIGTHLGYAHSKVELLGSRLLSPDGTLLIEGHGMVGEQYEYRIQTLNPGIEHNRLTDAIDLAKDELSKEKPTFWDRVKAILPR